MNEQTHFHDFFHRFVVSKFVKLSNEFIIFLKICQQKNEKKGEKKSTGNPPSSNLLQNLHSVLRPTDPIPFNFSPIDAQIIMILHSM